MMLQDMALQMLFGAMTGYITNDFALEMLFEKRFGLGGVIPRTREQFVDNISSLVEDDIVTLDVIAREIRKPEFDEAIKLGVNDFFENSLRDGIPENIYELPGFDKFAQNIAAYANEKMGVIMDQIVLTLDAHIHFDEILNEAQIRYTTEHILDELIYALEDTNLLEDFVAGLLKDIRDNEMRGLLDWIMAFVCENRDELEAMIGRAINSGVAKMGPMVSMLAGGLLSMMSSIPKEVVDKIADREKIESFLQSRITEICAGESPYLYNIKCRAVQRVREKREILLEKALSGIQNTIKDLSVNDVLEAAGARTMILAALEPEVFGILLKDVNPRTLYEKTIRGGKAGEKIKGRTGEAIREYTRDNASRLLSGRIKEFVKNHLGRYDENEIKETARDFIGRNLKPIVYFGAFLGTIVGFGLSFVSPAIIENIWARTLVYMAAFGLLGWATNFIAITMLFRPYRQYRLIPLFSPGYIMKNKPKFATSLGIFIDREILSGRIITRWFSDGKEGLKVRLGNLIAENDFKIVRTSLGEAQDELVHYAVDFEKGWLADNKDVIADKLAELIGRQEVKARISGNEKRIAAALEKRLRGAKGVEAAEKAAEAALELLFEKLMEDLQKRETVEKLTDTVYDSIAMLKGVPVMLETMARQIIAQVIQTLITEELPGFWASKSLGVRKSLVAWLDAGRIEQVVVYVKDNLNNQRAGQYLLNGEMRSCIARQVQGLAESEAFIQSELRSTGMIFSDILAHKTFMLGETLLDHIAQQGAGAVTDSLERNLGEILRRVNFAKITEEQVMKLDGRGIHKMFDSFMHKYFVSIRRYGLMGAAFGINAVSSVVFMCVYWVWCLYRKIRPPKKAD